jgi:DNA-binding transcriptional LysR family regulator
VAQTTVSARIRSLEEQLRRPLFVRNKAGAVLTPAGEQFLRHAPRMIQLWERARHEVAVPPGRRAVLAIGGELSLWEPFLRDWLLWMRRSAPDVALRASVGLSDDLMNQVAGGILDVAVVYAPRYRAGLKVEVVAEERLVMVTTPGRAVKTPNLGSTSASARLGLPTSCRPGAVVISASVRFAPTWRAAGSSLSGARPSSCIRPMPCTRMEAATAS